VHRSGLKLAGLQKGAQSAKRDRMSARSRGVPILMILILAVGTVAFFFGRQWWVRYLNHVSTDDAYVDATVTLITPRVSGAIAEIAVDENWRVERGDLLVRLDPTEYQVDLKSTEAALGEAQQTVEESRAAVRAAESQVRLSEAELDQAQLDNTREEELARKKVASVGDLDRTRTAFRVARARLEAARQNLDRARAALGIGLDAPSVDSPLVRRAIAGHERAALMLSYVDIYAPISGFVATKAVEVGQRVQPGQALLRIVPLERVYVEANFKETDLAGVRIGQPVTITADAYPDTTYRGVVDGLAPGTGAAFALLPPENATGNWIKVVQRLPIRIRLSEPQPKDRPLRVGLSVIATINVRNKEGPLLTPLSQIEQRKEKSGGKGQ
jgi:membrane fusion protein, multidrug efflux system